jgi:hypothetical protein
MPFAGTQQKRIACLKSDLASCRLQHARAIRQQCQARFRKRPASLPIETIYERCGKRIRGVPTNPFPTEVCEVNGIVKPRIIDWQGMAKWFNQAHL